MPEIFRYRGFRFFFYSNEGSPREPLHVHVEKDGVEAKLWMMNPQVEVAYNDGYNARTLRELMEVAEENRLLIPGTWMNSSVRAMAARCDADSLWVDLSDGRVLGVPLAWFPRLLHASADDLQQVRISSRGLHWEVLDEDISVAGLLAGLGDGTRRGSTVAA